jgi:hypothetical protein
MSLPTVAWFKTGDIPPASEVDISVDISKRITEDFGVTIGDTWSQIRQPGNPTRAGFANLDTTFQYQLLKDAPLELAMLVGLSVEWGGTGNTGAGLATSFSVLTPTFNFGQGFGPLPETLGWARPFALTGQVGYQVPTTSFDVGQGVFIPQVLVYGGSLQYSMPYLKSEVKDLGLPDLINHLIPLVEAQFATPVANNLGNSFVTTGTINPGVIWVGSYFQVGFEAIIPVNRDSGTGVGAVHAKANIRPVPIATGHRRRRRARTRHALKCEPACRRIGRRGAASGHAFLHARSRTRLQFGASDRQQGRTRRYRQSASQRQHHECRSEIVSAGNI